MIEAAVVVDPAANARIVHRGQVLQGFVATVMKRPALNCPTDALQRLRVGRGLKAVREDPLAAFPPHRLPGSQLEAQEVERNDRKVASPIHILAIDDLRLLGMQNQLAGRKATRQRTPEFPRLLDATAVTNRIVRITLEVRAAYMPDAARPVSCHPQS